VNHFKKIPLQIDTTKVEDTTRLEFKNTFYKWQKYGLRLLKDSPYEAVANKQYRLRPEDETEVLKCLPPSLLEIELPEVWVFNGKPNTDNAPMLAPHRDLVRLCGINAYFQTHGERTIFYQYKHEDLVEESSFVAEDGDCYILNVDVPHAVALTPLHTRKLMSISFITTPYHEVIKHF